MTMTDPRFVVATSDALDCYEQELREQRRTGSGFHGYMRARYSQHKLHVEDLMGTKEDRAPQPVTITRNGITVTVPGAWYTSTGKLKKKFYDEFQALFVPSLDQQDQQHGTR